QPDRFVRRRGLKLAEQGQVAKYPDRPALSRGDEVVAVDKQVARPGRRQVLLERLPVVAVVEADEHAGLVAGIEQARSDGIGADGGDDLVGGKAAGDLGPRLPAVVGAEDVRRPVVDPVAVDRDVSGGGVERRNVDAGNLAPRADSGKRGLGPARAAVTGHADDPGVAAGPHLGRRVGRGFDRDDGAVAARKRGLERDVAIAISGARLLADEVGADDRPAVPLVAALEQHVAAFVERRRIGPRRDQRRDPVEVVRDRGRPQAVIAERPRRDVRDLAGARVPAADPAAEAGAVDDVRVGWVGNVVVALVAAHRVPVAPRDLAVITSAGDGDGAAVLLARIDPVGEAVVGGEVIELAGRLVVPTAPRAAAVDGDRRALVGPLGDMAGILRVDPDRVIIVAAGASAKDIAGRAAAGAAADRLAGQINDVRVARIDRDAVEVIVGEGASRIDPPPVGAAVVRAPQAAVGLRIHVGIDPDVSARTGYRETDSAERSRRPAAAGELMPMRSFVVRAPHAAAGTRDFGEIALPRILTRFPGRGEQGARVLRAARDIVDAGIAAGRERVAPGPTAVGRAEDSARVAGPEEVPDGADDDRIRIGRADPDAADIFGVGEADVGPGL